MFIIRLRLVQEVSALLRPSKNDSQHSRIFEALPSPAQPPCIYHYFINSHHSFSPGGRKCFALWQSPSRPFTSHPPAAPSRHPSRRRRRGAIASLRLPFLPLRLICSNNVN
uniref:Uncharacterized protein n=1 Tax=Globodera pallida TaxID=36090 RepID=A0A183C8S8_GLOPA